MTIQGIYVNLPVRDIQKSREFWSGLGFSFNPQFSDENAICLELNPPTIYAMLLQDRFFKTFTDRPTADGATTEVLTAIQVESRERVDELVRLALEAGARRYAEVREYGWMYSDSFEDIDGHQWEFFFADESKIPENK